MISQLNPRERLFVVSGGIVVILALLYFALVMPYRSALKRLDDQIAARSQQLQEVKTLRSDYLALQNRLSRLEGGRDSRRDLSALTFVESLIARAGDRENLLSMRPQPPITSHGFTIETVEVKLEKLTLRQILELLRGLEGAPSPMQVKGLQIKQHFADRSLLDVTMTVTAARKTS